MSESLAQNAGDDRTDLATAITQARFTLDLIEVEFLKKTERTDDSSPRAT